MREMAGDLWEVAVALKADAIVITTNGFVKKNGEAVMGRGVAHQAKTRWPNLPFILGVHLAQGGNQVYPLCHAYSPAGPWIISFPVKHNWWERADPELIRVSAAQLLSMTEQPYYAFKTVVLPRPGCNNGRLVWEAVVRPIIAPILDDDRFVVVNNQ